MITFVDKKTGEVYEADVPFRTIGTASEYTDDESYEAGTSLTDISGYEPLESVIARCTRQVGGINSRGLQVLDMKALKEESHGVMTSYDVALDDHASSDQVDAAFSASYDPSDSPGFDLSDASEILSAVATNDNKDLSTSSQEEQLTIKQATTGAVGKSESDISATDDEIEQKAANSKS